MTHIASPVLYKTKKIFREAVSKDPKSVFVEDPSFYTPVSGNIVEVLDKLKSFTVTNHPRRSWFARVSRKNNNIVVE